MRERLEALAKKFAFRSGLVKTGYGLLLSPIEVYEFFGAIIRGEKIPGDVIEVGVARGKTTVFANALLDELGSSKNIMQTTLFLDSSLAILITRNPSVVRNPAMSDSAITM